MILVLVVILLEKHVHITLSLKEVCYEYCFVFVLFTYSFTAPDHVPDNIYTGLMYYERKGSNKWLMMFMVVQRIKVFLEVINMVPVSHNQTEPNMKDVG